MSYGTWVDRNLSVKEKLGNDEWLCLCVFHDNKTTPSMCVNVRKGVYVCYSCGEKGSIDKIARKLGTEARAVYTLRDTKSSVRSFKARVNGTHDDPVTIHPDEWLDQYRQEEALYDQWALRGITASTVDSMALGYAPFTTRKFGTHMTLCIPIRDVNNRVLGIIRRMVGKGLPPGQRYFYPYGFRITEHLFNAYNACLNEDHPLVVTEGSIDAMLMQQLGYPAVSILGANLAPHQRTIIRTLPHDDVVLMLDFDKPGQEATYKIAPDLLRDGFDVSIAQKPTRTLDQARRKVRPKDAGDMTVAQRRQCVENAISYLRLRIDNALP